MAEVKKINGYTLNDETSRSNIGCNADTYSNSRTYNVGDIVVYNKQIYKCKTAVTAAEAFDSEKWQQICLRDLVIGLKEELADRTETFSLKLFEGYETSNGFTGNMTCRRFGKVVTAYFSGTIKAGDLAFIKLDRELPEEFWPLQDVLIKAHVKETDSFSFYINADGKATGANMGNVYNNGETDVNIKAVATYIVDSGSSGSQDIQVSEEFIEETLAAIEILNQENVDQQEKIDALMKDYEKKAVQGSSIHINDSLEYDMPLFPNGGIEQDTRQGYNQLDITVHNENNVTVTNNTDTSIELETTNYTNNSTIYFYAKNLKAGVTYKASALTQILSGVMGSGSGRLELYSTSKEWLKTIGQYSGSTNKSQGTFTVDTDGNYQIRYLLANANAITETLKVKVSEFMVYDYTSQTDKDYEKFGQMPSLAFPSEVKGVSGHYDNYISDNFFDNVFRQGSYSIMADTKRVFSQNDFEVKAGQEYTVLTNLDISTYYYVIGLATKAFPTSTLISDSGWLSLNEYKFIAKDNAYFGLGIRRKDNGNITPSDIENVYFEVVTKHQLKPLDIPTGQVWYSGKPYKENGKWYRDVEWGKYSPKGEDVSQVLSNNRFSLKVSVCSDRYILPETFYSNKIDKPYIYSNIAKSYYNNSLSQLSAITGSDLVTLWNSTTIGIMFRVESITTLEEAKALLNSNEVYIVYKLAKPYAEEITDTTLISQLEELQKAHSYYEVTNINSYGSEDAADLVLSGEYVRSNKIRIENLEKAILSLGGNV